MHVGRILGRKRAGLLRHLASARRRKANLRRTAERIERIVVNGGLRSGRWRLDVSKDIVAPVGRRVRRLGSIFGDGYGRTTQARRTQRWFGPWRRRFDVLVDV